MAVFGSGGSRIGGGRGPSFGFRFFCYALLSVVLMFYDNRGGWLETARYGLHGGYLSAAARGQLAVRGLELAEGKLRHPRIAAKRSRRPAHAVARTAAHHDAPGGAAGRERQAA